MNAVISFIRVLRLRGSPGNPLFALSAGRIQSFPRSRGDAQTLGATDHSLGARPPAPDALRSKPPAPTLLE